MRVISLSTGRFNCVTQGKGYNIALTPNWRLKRVNKFEHTDYIKIKT